MPQIIRPDASTTRVPPSSHNFVPAVRGQATMHGCMDEAAPIAADYTECLPGSIDDVLVVGLGDPTTTPTSDFNHIIRFCASKDASGGASVGFICELRQAYVSESSLGTLVASFAGDNIPSTVDTYFRYRLTEAEAALITDYTDLQLRFRSANARGGAPRSCRLHWAECQLPTAGERATDLHLTAEELQRQDKGQDVTQASDRRTTGSTSRH